VNTPRVVLRGLLAVAAAVSCVSLGVAPAQAEALSIDDLPTLPSPAVVAAARRDVLPSQQQLSKLTPEQRKAVPVELRYETTGLTPAEFKNIYAWNGTDDIWRWSLPIDWCWNGWSVTSISSVHPSWHIYSWAATLGWSYEGMIDQDQWDYYGDGWVYRSFAQSHFQYCPPWIGCLSHMYPYEFVDTYGDGGAGTAGWGGANHT
jgi:hypothetical protein